MLETLRIENFALIESIELDFQSGFNVLTGETGAGKSILIGALQMVLGARASTDVVRHGAKKAVIEIVAKIDTPSSTLATLLDEHDIELEEGRLLLARQVSSEGRSKAYAGGRLVALSVLSALGDELVDLHGQHEHQSLLKPDRQLLLLDSYAGALEQAASVRDAVSALRACERELEELRQEDRERERRIDFLRHEVAEIDGAGLEPGDDDALAARLKIIQNAERIHELAARAFEVLNGDGEQTALDLIDRALKEAEELAEIDGELAQHVTELTEARELASGVAESLRSYAEQCEFDPGELEELNQRNAALQQLKRKYGETLEDIIAYRDRAAAELERFDSRDARIAELEAEAKCLADAAREAAERLSRSRRKAGKQLERAITANLQELGMKGASFAAVIEPAELSSNGIDDVRFLLAANPGEPPKPLKKVASGGEVSRIMLALKSVFAESDAIPTLVFDEIDTGVGGEIARAVAAKINALAQSHQVLCVSHLAQLGAVAQTHFQVSKSSTEKHATTRVDRIDGKERVDEIARLLDGSVSTESVRHAKALMKQLAG